MSTRRRARRSMATATLCAALLATAGCSGGSEDSSATTSAPERDDVAAASTTAAPTTPAPEDIDVATLLTDRLTTEFGDASTAEAVVAGLTPESLAALSAAIPPSEIATAPELSYLPTTTPGPVDHLVVLAFGNRVGADGATTAGPTNEALADGVEGYVADHPTPVFAQWEVAELLTARGVPDVVSIEPVVGPDGTITYLSTSGVTDQVVALASDEGIDLGTVGVVGFADHVVRCVMTATASGIDDAVVVEGLELPTAYDPESGQEWTRDRVAYLSVDLAGRIAAL